MGKKISRSLKNMSPTLKLLLIIIFIGVLAFGYINGIYKPTETKKVTLQTEIEEVKEKIEFNKSKKQKMEQMETALLDENYTYQKILTYNAQPQIMKLLSDASKLFAKDANVSNRKPWSFDGVENPKLMDKNTGMYERDIKLEFATSDYKTAKRVLEELYNSNHMNIITDVVIDGSPNGPVQEDKDKDVKVVATVVFFEKDYNYKKSAEKVED